MSVAVTNGYCTTQQVHDHLTGTPDFTAAEDRLARSINAASRSIDQACNRRFYVDADVSARTYRVGKDDSAYHLHVDDISTVTGLIVKTASTDAATYDQTWTINEDFLTAPENLAGFGHTRPIEALLAVGDYLFPTWGRFPRIQVTAKWGWPAVPDEIEHAAILIAARIYRRSNSPDGFVGVSDFGPARISRQQDPTALELLGPFIKRRVLVG